MKEEKQKPQAVNRLEMKHKMRMLRAKRDNLFQSKNPTNVDEESGFANLGLEVKR